MPGSSHVYRPTLAAYRQDPRDPAQDVYQTARTTRDLHDAVRQAPPGTVSIMFFNPDRSSVIGGADRLNESQEFFLRAHMADGVIHLPGGTFMAFDPNRHVIVDITDITT